MPEIVCRVVDVYVYRHVGTVTEFLLLKRSSTVVYPGQWRMIGGKILPGETGPDAAVRELREETGLGPVRLWTLPSVNVFYEHTHDRVNMIPAFAAELDSDPILNHEHDQFAWFERDRALSLLVWPEQQRLLSLASLIVEQDAILDDWVIDL